MQLLSLLSRREQFANHQRGSVGQPTLVRQPGPGLLAVNEEFPTTG